MDSIILYQVESLCAPVQRYTVQGYSAAAISQSHTSSYAANVTTSLSVPSVTSSQFLVSSVPPSEQLPRVPPSPFSNIPEQNISAGMFDS